MTVINFLVSAYLFNRKSFSLINSKSSYNALIILLFEGFLKYVICRHDSKRLIIGLSNRSVLGINFHAFLSKHHKFKSLSNKDKQNFLEVNLLRQLRRKKSVTKSLLSIK